MKRRLYAGMLVLVLIFSMTACGKPAETKNPDSGAQASENMGGSAENEVSIDTEDDMDIDDYPADETDIDDYIRDEADMDIEEEDTPDADLSQIILKEAPDVSSYAEASFENPAQFGQWVQVTQGLSVRHPDGNYEKGYTPIYYRITGMSDPLTPEEMDAYALQVIANDTSDYDVDYMQEWREADYGYVARRIDYEVYIPQTDFEGTYGNYYDGTFFSVDAQGELASCSDTVTISPRDAIYDELDDYYPNGGCVIKMANVGYFAEDKDSPEYAPYLMLSWYNFSSNEDEDRYFLRP